MYGFFLGANLSCQLLSCDTQMHIWGTSGSFLPDVNEFEVIPRGTIESIHL